MRVEDTIAVIEIVETMIIVMIDNNRIIRDLVHVFEWTRVSAPVLVVLGGSAPTQIRDTKILAIIVDVIHLRFVVRIIILNELRRSP